MKAVQISKRNGPLELVERNIPEPGRGQVRIRVEACGVCHGEVVALEGHHPDMQYPRIPGHEVIGVIDQIGDDVHGWSQGERVGVGWNGGHDETTGLTLDGGYAQYMIAYADGLARIPEGLSAVDAAPLMCAGVTTFGALKHSSARAGDLVVIQGIGGLGHLAIQYARKAGFHTVAVSRGRDKEELALKLGAHRYIDAQSEDAAKVLQEMGERSSSWPQPQTDRRLQTCSTALAPMVKWWSWRVLVMPCHCPLYNCSMAAVRSADGLRARQRTRRRPFRLASCQISGR
ncbi:alcohol dehydrogenase catalytic domain-containing protein [Alicyclobacillus fastidiosus]|uniref:alcohol dehydrogenase catalytic domain-containing protein n=1 Tax=Alicyclobacillus fastidiosus TaxID=392011 RepID=UPI0024E16652|nr:alcohol dehydrogenase catalytic domain-containing protein [Alicyclobacillus fastidiosus]